MTGGQIFLMALLTMMFSSLAWQEYQRGNSGTATLFAAIPTAAWLAILFGKG
jgi:hypothetical protein